MCVVCFDEAMYTHERHPSTSRQVVGQLIRTARYARGMTQETLEEWAGVDQTVISRLETGRPIGLRFGTLLRLIDALGIASLQPTYRAWHPWSEGADLFAGPSAERDGEPISGPTGEDGPWPICTSTD